MFRFLLGVILGVGTVYVINEHPDLAARAASSIKAELDRHIEQWLRRQSNGSNVSAASPAGLGPVREWTDSYAEQFSELGWRRLWHQLESSGYGRRAAAAAIILERSQLAADPAAVRKIEERYLRAADPQVRRTGFSYLGVLALLDIDPDRIESLCRSYVERHPSDEAADAALWALGQLGRTSLAQYFVSIAANPARYGPQLRRRALCCLARSGRYSREQRRSFLPLLEGHYRTSRDEQTRAWVAEAIRDCSA